MHRLSGNQELLVVAVLQSHPDMGQDETPLLVDQFAFLVVQTADRDPLRAAAPAFQVEAHLRHRIQHGKGGGDGETVVGNAQATANGDLPAEHRAADGKQRFQQQRGQDQASGVRQLGGVDHRADVDEAVGTGDSLQFGHFGEVDDVDHLVGGIEIGPAHQIGAAGPEDCLGILGDDRAELSQRGRGVDRVGPKLCV